MDIQYPITYFEPNKEIEYKPEDLTVGIYLEVESKSRGILDGGVYRGDVTIGSKPLDFFQGEDGVLTTSYTDITVMELRNGGHVESIGIESINIKYNTWYFPEVNIKFVDVRGNSVFNPYETTNDPETKESAKKPFLSCFFSFPYPVFKLTVKGYYGKPVTYRLTVKDVRSQFNPATGNFELNANFIGYMYSYLTDVPMRMLFAAPYIEYDGVSSDLGAFSSGYAAGQVIPTFIDFVKALAEGMQMDGAKSGVTNATAKMQMFISLLSHIENIKNAYHFLYETINKECEILGKENKVLSFKYKIESEPVENDIEAFANVLNSNINIIKHNWDRVYELREHYLGSEESQKNTITYDSLVIATETANFFGVQNINGQRSIVDGEGNVRTLTLNFDYDNDCNLLNEIKSKVEKSKKIAEDEIDVESKSYYNSILNWQPTLRNVFEMTLVHLNKFYDNMSRCIDNIHQASSQRILSTLKVDTDCNSHSKDITVYPFPAFYDSDDNFMWIGQVDGAFNYHERELVEKTIEGIQASKKEIEAALSEYEVAQESVEEFPRAGIPTLLYDLRSGTNPYFHDGDNIVSSNGGEDIPLAMKILAKRLMIRKIYNSNVVEDENTTLFDATTFGELEALNFLNQVINHEQIKQEKFFTESQGVVKTLKYIEENALKWFGGITQNAIQYEDTTSWHRWFIEDCLLVDNERGNFAPEDSPEMYYYEGKGYYKNALLQYDETEYHNRMAGVFQYINHETYDKVFPTNINSKEIYRKLGLQGGNNGFLNNSSFANDIVSGQTIFTMSKNAFEDEKNRLKITFGDVEVEKSVIDFFPIFKGNNTTDIYTRISLDAEITKKETWWAKVFNTDKDSDYRYSFSCKKYWDIRNTTWAEARTDERCEQIVVDFFKTIGLTISTNLSITLLQQMENHGIVCLSKMELMYLGYLVKQKRKGTYEIEELKNIFNMDSATVAEQFYEDNYRSLADTLVNYVLDDTIYNKESGKGQDLVIFTTENKSIQYFVKVLSTKTKEVLRDILNSKYCLYNLHGYYGAVRIKGFNNIIDDFEANTIISSFLNKVTEVCGLDIAEIPETTEPIGETNVNTPVKLGVYNVMKNLYDRWKFGAYRTQGNGMYSNETCVTINNFVFRNVFNEDIGDRYLVNTDKFIKLIDSIAKGDSEMSVYNFLYEICGIADCMMLCLPVNIFEAANSQEKLQDMFTPHNYISAKDEALQTTYIVTLRNKDSEHLSFQPNTSEYKDDGVDFTNYHVKADKNDGNRLGVFGVTYGLNEQHYFKDIKVSMDKPKVTEQSIASLMQIVEGHKSGSTEMGRVHHDLYDTYSSHSYSCTVEMMGNAQIMPMLYFQLNNIPLFKGGYLIVNVEHTLNSQGMTTTFIGNRISKYQFDLNLKGLEFNAIADGNYSNGGIATPSSSPAPVVGKGVNSENLNYSKETTVILIDAGHYMAVPGKESPNLDDEFNAFEDERVGDGILNPYDINGNEVYRYREYWGSRKIAYQLYQKLKSNGFQVEMVFHNRKDAENFSKFTDKVNGIYNSQKAKGHSTIIISFHSNAAANSGWGTGNRWEIYKQSPMFVESKGKWITPPHMDTSGLLAECIAKKAAEEFKKADDFIPTIMKSGSKEQKMSVHTTPKTFNHERNGRCANGIRPTTFSYAPSVLSENLFHDTKSHIKFLASQKGRDIIVNLHYNGILEFFDKVPKPKK
jgi:N-acetylmuramoyl-L-alanine amidase